MKHSRTLIIAFASCLLLLASSETFAYGVGACASIGSGSFNFRELEKDESSRSDVNSYLGGGILFDTAVAEDEVFNYRVNFGFEIWKRDFVLNEDTGRYHITLYNSFGFGIVRLQWMRLWLGPQLGLQYLRQSATGSSYRHEGFGMTLGAVAGVNFNIGRDFSIGLDGGGRYRFSYMGSDRKEAYDFFHYGIEGFANLSFIYRIDDEYSR
jgi:hypothetical protein